MNKQAIAAQFLREAEELLKQAQAKTASPGVQITSISIDGYRIEPARVRLIRDSENAGRFLIEFVLKEGRNRQIRNMCEQAGLKIHRLVRRKTAGITLSGLKPGQWRDVSVKETAHL